MKNKKGNFEQNWKITRETFTKNVEKHPVTQRGLDQTRNRAGQNPDSRRPWKLHRCITLKR